MNNNSNKPLNILKILTIILTVSSFIILTGKVLSVLLTVFGGLLLLTLIVLLGVCTLGIIFLTPFGTNLWNSFLGVWDLKFSQELIKYLSIVQPYILWINFCINILYLVISIFNKSKKNIIISSIILIFSIIMLILYLIGV